MAVHRLAELTWEEVRDLDGNRVVGILPVGAVEAHGPHLPLTTDVIIAEGMAAAGGERLSALGWEALLLPPLTYTPAGFAAGFPGTIPVRPGTTTAVLMDIAVGLAEQGVRALAVANGHLDPAHLGAVHAAREALVRRRLLAFAFPDLTRKPWASRLTEEFRTGACHAGRYEGSLVLALRPDLVREAVARELPPNPASLSEAIRDGKRTFEEAGGPRAYFGWPAEATREEGERTLEVLGEILAEALLSAVEAGGEAAEAGGDAVRSLGSGEG